MVTVIVFNVIVITLAVLIHYEFLYRITSWLPHMRVRQRFRIVLIVLIALTAHAVEVWLFAVAFFVMHHADGWGHLQGNFGGELLDLSLIHISEPTRPTRASRMPSSA